MISLLYRWLYMMPDGCFRCMPDLVLVDQISDACAMHVGAGTLIFTELLLFGWVETKRLYDLRNPGSQGDGSFFGITDGFKGKENGYPGTEWRGLHMCVECKSWAGPNKCCGMVELIHNSSDEMAVRMLGMQDSNELNIRPRSGWCLCVVCLPAWNAGGVFDPFGFSRGDQEQYKMYKVKEIKNGRLAMVAFVGFIAQVRSGFGSERRAMDIGKCTVARVWLAEHKWSQTWVNGWSSTLARMKTVADKGLCRFTVDLYGMAVAWPPKLVLSLTLAPQHHATGKTPIQNLVDHLASPYTTTFATNGVSVPHYTEFNWARVNFFRIQQAASWRMGWSLVQQYPVQASPHLFFPVWAMWACYSEGACASVTCWASLLVVKQEELILLARLGFSGSQWRWSSCKRYQSFETTACSS
jgi:hypothetical protein